MSVNQQTIATPGPAIRRRERRPKRPATIEDLYRVPGKAEIVNGRIVHLMPTGRLPGYAGQKIAYSLQDHATQTNLGYAVGDNQAFTVNLPNRKSFSPDAGY